MDNMESESSSALISTVVSKTTGTLNPTNDNNDSYSTIKSNLSIKRKERENGSPQKNSSKTSRISSSERVQPLLFFAVPSRLTKMQIEVELEDKCEGIEIDQLKITSNYNLLIYPKTDNDKKALLAVNDLFKDFKKLDLACTEKNPCLVLKGLSLDDIETCETWYQSLCDIGVNKIDAIKDKDNKLLKMVRLYFESKEDYDKVSNEHSVKVGHFRYPIENARKQVVQCHKCKKFGHTESVCRTTSNICQTCGGNHDISSCTSSVKKCANCSGEHSAYWKGCPAYKKAYIVKQSPNTRTATKDKEPLSSKSTVYSGPPEGFTRTYSAATGTSTSTQALDTSQLEKKLDAIFVEFAKFESKLNTCNESFQNLVVKVVTETLDKFTKINNAKICYLVLDIVKILCPSQVIFNNEQTNAIITAFDSHKLGHLDAVAMWKYADGVNKRFGHG